MKKLNRPFIKITISIFLMMLLTMSLANAEKKIFNGTGEYNMSDYETAAVAEQRALSYAKQRIAEQAGAYVETYTRMENVQVTEDRVHIIVNSVLRIIKQNTEKQILPNGDVHILANMTAEVDSENINVAFKREDEDNKWGEKIYHQLNEAIAREAKEIVEIKRKILELKRGGVEKNDLELEVKIKEREFLSNSKVEKSSVLCDNGNLYKALSLADEAIKLNPKNDAAYINRGYIFYKMHNAEEAKKNVTLSKFVRNETPNPDRIAIREVDVKAAEILLVLD